MNRILAPAILCLTLVFASGVSAQVTRDRYLPEWGDGGDSLFPVVLGVLGFIVWFIYFVVSTANQAIRGQGESKKAARSGWMMVGFWALSCFVGYLISGGAGAAAGFFIGGFISFWLGFVFFN